MQATCLRALEKSAQFTPGTRIDRWLFSILHSIWISELRARQVRLGQGFVECEELAAPEPGEQDDTRWRYRQLMLRVNQLPEAQRNAVFLVYVEGFSYQEAAARETLAKTPAISPPAQEKRS